MIKEVVISSELADKISDAAEMLEEINMELSAELGKQFFPLKDFRRIDSVMDLLVDYVDQYKVPAENDQQSS